MHVAEYFIYNNVTGKVSKKIKNKLVYILTNHTKAALLFFNKHKLTISFLSKRAVLLTPNIIQ